MANNRKRFFKRISRYFRSWLDALDYSSSDYVLDRISVLEQEAFRSRAEALKPTKREAVRHH